MCFRETDPLRMERYLVFPELINLKKPPEEEQASEDGVAYTVSGPTENVFASLVVLLGYTHTFTRTNQWHNNARYEVGGGLLSGFRQEAQRDGESDFVLCFDPMVGAPVRTLFQGLFESFLGRRNLQVLRYEPVRCGKADCGHLLDRSVVRQRIEKSDRIVMVGTPLYRRKYENKDTSTGYVVAAEVDLIANRLLGTEAQKASVLPLLLVGTETASLPPLLQRRVYADFRDESKYFTAAFDLILSLYQLPPNHPAVADLRESLRGPEMR